MCIRPLLNMCSDSGMVSHVYKMYDGNMYSVCVNMCYVYVLSYGEQVFGVIMSNSCIYVQYYIICHMFIM